MKKLFCLFLAIVMTASYAPMVEAVELKENSIAEAKRALAQAHADEYIEGYAETEEAGVRNQQIDEILVKIQNGEVEKQTGITQLEAMGVYCLETASDSNENTNSSRMASQIDIGTVSVAFDAPTGNWILSASGRWTGDGWKGNQSLNYLNGEVSIGGFDGIGLCFYNTSGTYSASMISAYAYISGGEDPVYYRSPTYMNGMHGAYFLFSDVAKYHGEDDDGSEIWLYHGKSFSVIMRYTREFENYNGYAKLQYTHTWGAGKLTGVNYGSNGFEPVIQYNGYSLSVESGTEMRF